MKKIISSRRYLVNFDVHNLPHIFVDVLVIGSGSAGLTAAIEAAKYGLVMVVTKDKAWENNTHYAQGGIAAVLNPDDSFDSHIQDTLEVGVGLCSRSVVEEVVKEGPKRVKELVGLGVRFDREDGQIALTKEGGHSHQRIVHAKGDSTGLAVEDALIGIARRRKNIHIWEHCFAIDLLVADGTCKGALLWHRQKGKVLAWAKETVLASGGCGQLYRETTNPDVATGDGFAMAFRAGAALQDLEFMQFHPTTLYIAGAARALISETVRGEGGFLINKDGQRFMHKYHPKAELAPRDIVSCSILKEMQATGHTHVYLDVTHIEKEKFRLRFPKIYDICTSFGIDTSKDPIPVRPSAHYMIGGVKVNAHAATNIRHLYACGEVACTGLHGANRLGSNSLLECLVYGHRAGQEASKGAKRTKAELVPHLPEEGRSEPRRPSEINISDVSNALKSLMWRCVGIERTAYTLREARHAIEQWRSYIMDKEFTSPHGWELQNMLTLAGLITEACIEREETRGVHCRSDFPKSDDAHWKKHITLYSTQD